MPGTVTARMVGGPVARQVGEVTLGAGGEPPDRLFFGAEGGFVYRLDNRATPRKVGGKRSVVYRYDKTETAAKLQHLGVPLGVVASAVDDEMMALRAAAGVIDREEIAGIEVRVDIQRWPDRWDAVVDGEVVESLPREEIEDDDADAIKAFAEQVGRTVADGIRAQREAASA